VTSAQYEGYCYCFADNSSGRFGRVLAGIIIDHVERLGNAGRVCELGCGNGYLAKILAPHCSEIVGVDRSESGISMANLGNVANARFICSGIDGELTRMLSRNSFALFVSTEVIEHM